MVGMNLELYPNVRKNGITKRGKFMGSFTEQVKRVTTLTTEPIMSYGIDRRDIRPRRL